ncbi:MAG: protoheme IX farnesyltransferase [Saprospiraceae bacterium]|nr:protoheme IX farnesyltransferase [Saprospiraceae bacterium]
MLVKMRLTLLVVFSALLAYLIVAQDQMSFLALSILGLGGFCITAAANALNQALEKDYDRLMTRTANRPVATGRMSMSEAIMTGGLLFVAGIVMLAYFNPLSAVLGACAVVSYAFLYTPLKRITSLSVFVGAVPGALPTMIAVVAFEGQVTTMALILFGIQFFWQFAHFWSIGFLGYDDYKRAGFKLVPEQDNKVHPNLGLQSMIFSLLLLPFALAPYALGLMSWLPCIFAVILSLGYAYYGWRMQILKNQLAAKKLMFYSFIYLPLVLIIYYIGSI